LAGAEKTRNVVFLPFLPQGFDARAINSNAIEGIRKFVQLNAVIFHVIQLNHSTTKKVLKLVPLT
jgi:hypothetical protein